MAQNDAHIQVKHATDIVELIGEHVRVVPAGKEFKCLCPFHDDKNPSMHIVPHKQFYKCFSCGVSGDVYTFVMEYHKMTFPEALAFLAKRVGIELPERTHGGGSKDGKSEREKLREANASAAMFYRRMIKDKSQGESIRAYAVDRGISDEMMDAFQVGYAPDGWDGLVRFIQKQKMDIASFQNAGLVASRKNGDGHYDFLRHRLVFPIIDAMGHTIAFGGRKIREEDEPKYLNSPESAIFNKSATLYGIHLANRAIINSRTVIIVEGYTDVIACHQAGINNVVATLGTALTREHAKMLRRYADQVILVFDADEAGQKAADRGLEVFFLEPIDVNIAILPDRLDPADLLAKNDGLDLWQKAMSESVDAMSFQFNRMRHQFDSTQSLSGKQRIAEDYIRNMIQLGLNKINIARRGLVVSKLASILKLDVRSIEQMVHQLSGVSAVRLYNDDDEFSDIEIVEEKKAAVSHLKASRALLGCLLNDVSLFNQTMLDGRPLCETMAADDFHDSSLKRLYTVVSEYLFEADIDEIETLELREVLSDESLLRLALNLKYEVDQLIEQTESTYSVQALAAVSALTNERAEQDYATNKLHMQMNDNETIRTAEDNDRLMQAAVAHLRAHPSGKRAPRIDRKF